MSNEHLQRVFLLFFVIYLTFIGGTVYSGIFMPLKIFFQGSVTLILGIWLARLVWKKQPFPQSPLNAPLAAYFIWLLVTTLFSENTRISLESVWRYLIHIGGFFLILALIQAGRQRWLFEAISLCGGVIVLLSLIEIGGSYFRIEALSLFGQSGDYVFRLETPVEVTFYRLSLALNLSTVQANYVALILPVIFIWGLTVSRADNRLGLLLVSAGLAVVLLLTFSRGGWIAAVVAFGVLFLFRLRRTENLRLWLRPSRLIPIVLVGLLMLGGVFFIFVQRGGAVFDEKRIDLWQIGAEMTTERPLTGYGINQYSKEYWERHDTDHPNKNSPTAHNILLNTSAEAGIPGLLILLWLVGVFLVIWRRAWQQATPGRRLRLEGIMAAFAGLAVFNMVDMFTSTTSIFPVALFVAYTLAGQHTPKKPAPRPEPMPFWRGVRIYALLLLLVYSGWLLGVVNRADDNYRDGFQAVAQNDLQQALQVNKDARTIDPTFELYDIQHAYILGLLAESNPTQYLEEAITIHEKALDNHPAFHVGQANLAVLYGQQGKYPAAIKAAQQAHQYLPENSDYLTLIAFYQESAGRDEAARETYLKILEEDSQLARSSFWLARDAEGARRLAFDEYYASASLDEKLWIDVVLDWQQQAEQHAQQLTEKRNRDALDFLALAKYAESQEDFASALEWYNHALEGDTDRTTKARVYLERGFVYLALGKLDQAKDDAEEALFENSQAVPLANYLLAVIEIKKSNPPPDDVEVNRLLASAFPEREGFAAYISNVFNRPSSFALLPQASAIQSSNYARTYAPHLLLAQRFGEDSDPETDPASIYRLVPRELRPAEYR